MITIACSNGTRYRGRTVESIIRREFGRTAFLRHSSDPNSPHLGQVCKSNGVGSYNVLATVAWAE